MGQGQIKAVCKARASLKYFAENNYNNRPDTFHVFGLTGQTLE